MIVAAFPQRQIAATGPPNLYLDDDMAKVKIPPSHADVLIYLENIEKRSKDILSILFAFK